VIGHEFIFPLLLLGAWLHHKHTPTWLPWRILWHGGSWTY
jgi:hypothetical protein